MIQKLYDLKQRELDQQSAQKQKLITQMMEYEAEIETLQLNLSQSSVKMFGSISDFKILAIHKNTMRDKKEKLQKKKVVVESQIEAIDLVIVEIAKEVEKYNYLLKEEKRKAIKAMEKVEERVANEFIQARWTNR